MRILVIGGTRFIGPRVVSRLLAGGHEVALFHRGQAEPDERSECKPARAQPSREATVECRHIHGDRKQLEQYAGEFTKFAPETVLDMVCMKETDALKVTAIFHDLARRIVMLSKRSIYVSMRPVHGSL